MTEELLYLSMLVSRVNNQYELCLARDLVADKYPDMELQEIQESFEELAVCIKSDISFPDENPFSIVASRFYRGYRLD